MYVLPHKPLQDNTGEFKEILGSGGLWTIDLCTKCAEVRKDVLPHDLPTSSKGCGCPYTVVVVASE